MYHACRIRSLGLLLGIGLIGCLQRAVPSEPIPLVADSGTKSFVGTKAGDQRTVASVVLRWCPPGKFVMGSPRDEPERRPDEDRVEVTLTCGFWAGQDEVTQEQWQRAMQKFPEAQPPPQGGDFPVVSVNYLEAEAFSRKLTERGHHSGELPSDWEFRLPTEAQWEYACRAGTATATAFGPALRRSQANFQLEPYNTKDSSPPLGRAARVGSYPANAWGLRDFHGNVYEWCRDWYHWQLPGGVDPDLSSRKGSRNRDGTYSRVRRGGGWTDPGWPCRSAARHRFEPDRRSDHIGFRVVAVHR